MPEEIANPLIALGGLLILTAFAFLMVYGSDYIHHLRKPRSARQPAHDKVPRAAAYEASVERVQPAQAEARPPRLARQQWLDILNNQPDQVPHVFIIGPTGAGKTTFATAMLAERSGRIVVLTAKTDDSWGGLPFVSIDDSGTYTAMQAMFDQLDTEVRARLVASKNKQPVGEPLTIVLDDYAVIAKECKPVAAQVFKLVARLGRSMRVRLVVLSTTGRVKSLDLEGEGDTLTNFISVELNRQRSAACVWEEQRYQLDTAHVPSGARQSLAAKQWVPLIMVSSIFSPSSQASTLRRAGDMPRAGTRRYELLDELLTPAEQQSSRAHTARMVAFADAEQTEQAEQVFGALQSTEQSTMLPGDREALVRFLVRQGWSANDIVKNVKGDSSTLYPIRIKHKVKLTRSSSGIMELPHILIAKGASDGDDSTGQPRHASGSHDLD